MAARAKKFWQSDLLTPSASTVEIWSTLTYTDSASYVITANREKFCFVVFCAEIDEILQQFSLTFAKRLQTSCVFLSHGETFTAKTGKIDNLKSFDSIEIFIRVD